MLSYTNASLQVFWIWLDYNMHYYYYYSFPVAQTAEHGASNAKVIASIPIEKKELMKK